MLYFHLRIYYNKHQNPIKRMNMSEYSYQQEETAERQTETINFSTTVLKSDKKIGVYHFNNSPCHYIKK